MDRIFNQQGVVSISWLNYEKLRNDPFILKLMKEYQILFLSEPCQTVPHGLVSMSQEWTTVVD